MTQKLNEAERSQVRDNIALSVFSTCYMALRQYEMNSSKVGEHIAFDDIWTASAIDAYKLADAALYVREHPELVTSSQPPKTSAVQSEPSA